MSLPATIPPTHRALPASIEAERSVLSAILLDPERLMPEAVSTLPLESLHSPALRTVYGVMRDIYNDGKPVEPIAIQEALLRENLMERVGGPATLAEIMTAAPDAGHFDFHRDLVVEKWGLRYVIGAATELLTLCYNVDGYEDVANLAESKLTAIASWRGESRRASEDFRDSVLRVAEIIEDRRDKPTTEKIWFGIRALDRVLHGLPLGSLTVIAAKPSGGKTALAMTAAYHNCEQGTPVGVFSMETTVDELIERAFAAKARVDGSLIDSGELSLEDLAEIGRAAHSMGRWPLHVDERGGLTLEQVRATARVWATKHGVKVLIVDFCQLVSPSNPRESREETLSAFANGFKALCKEVDCAGILLSQLTDDGRGNVKTKHATAITEAADKILIIDADGNIGVAKNKRGPRGITVEGVRLNGPFVVWEEMDKEEEDGL